MSVQLITIVTCDICKLEMGNNEQRVFAGSYGYDFHLTCLEKVDGTILGKLTDELRVGTTIEYGDKPNHAPRFYWNEKINNEHKQ
jgi:hypothetical protein